MQSIRRSRSTRERQRQKNEETKDDIFQSSTPAVEQEVPEDAVPRSARKGRAGCKLGINADSGK